MPTGISGLYKNTKGAKEAEKRNKERDRLIELFCKFVIVCPESCVRGEGCIKCVYGQVADLLLSNGIRVEIPNNTVSLVDGHIEE